MENRLFFLRFLKDNGIYASFKVNYNKQGQWRNRMSRMFAIPQDISINKYTSIVSNGLMMQLAFDWSATDEGPMFWSDAQTKWLRLNNYIGV